MTTSRRPAMALDAETLLTHSAWLARLARALVARDDEIEDVVQQTYAQALDRPPLHARNVRGWLGTIARNVVRSSARSSAARVAREIAVPAPPPVETPVEAVERAELRRMVVESVLALEEPYRSTVVLRFFEEQDVAVIARLTSAGEDTVRTRIRRGVQRVRELLERKVDAGARGAADEGAAASALLFLRLREIAASGGGGATGSAAAARGFSRTAGEVARNATARKIAAGAAIALVVAGGWWWRSREAEPEHSYGTVLADRQLAAESMSPSMPPPLAVTVDEEPRPRAESPASTQDSKIAESCAIHGQVTDPRGSPVARAHVWALLCAAHEPEWDLQDFANQVEDAVREDAAGLTQANWVSATTDDDGRYEFANLATLHGWQIGAFHSRFGAQVSDVQSFSRELRSSIVDLPLVRGARIRGSVADESGSPIGNAVLRVISKSGDGGWEKLFIAGATGPGLGHYDAGFQCGERIEIDCRAGGYLTSKRTVVEFDTPVDEVIVDLAMKRRNGTIVRGGIVDPSGRPLDLLALLAREIPSNSVEFLPYDASLCAIPSDAYPPPTGAGSTLPPGSAVGRIDYVAGMYEVVVPDGFCGVLELRILGGVVGTATLLDPNRPVPLPCDAQRIPSTGPSATFPIRFVDAETKLPIDLSHEAAPPRGNDGTRILAKAMVDSEPRHGLIVYRCAPGYFKLDVDIRGYARGQHFLDVPEGRASAPHVLELPRAEATLRGVIHHADGAPAPKARVSIYRRDRDGLVNASGANVATNLDGEFAFSSLGKGEHFVVVFKLAGAAPAVVPVDAVPAAAPLAIRLSPGQPVKFRVITSPAPKSARTIVRIDDPNGLMLDVVESNATAEQPSASEFSFSLAPGRYVVHVERTGFVERDITFDVPMGDEIVVALNPIEREPK